MSIKEKTTIDAWRNALKFVKDKGNDFIDEDGRVCREVFNIYIEVLNPSKDVIKPIETIEWFKKWFYPPLSEISNTILSKNIASMYKHSPGARLFSYNDTINQLDDFVIPLLRSNPTSRRAIAVLWNPLIDSNINKKDMPSMMVIDFKLRKNKLNVTMTIRSNDMFMGWPANIYQIHTLQGYVCGKLKIDPGFIGIFSTSAHIFEDKFEEIDKIIKGTYRKKK